MHPFSKQSINNDDISEVIKVLKSEFLTQGPKVLEFEKKFSKFVKSKFAVASNSGSSSLHLACLALNIKKGDIVWTVPNTFVASANCAINCGAEVDFVDINKQTWNIDINELEKKLLLARKKKKLPKVIIPVHFAGLPTDQKKIWQLSKKFRFKIIEDASHSLGAKNLGEPVGSCKWSDITIFSFHPTKIITTGEGGMATTNNRIYKNRMNLFRTNGITKDLKHFEYKRKNEPWYYEHQKPGFNFRMNDISAALGISQLKRIKKFLIKRNLIAEKYKKKFENLSISTQLVSEEKKSSYHLFIIKFDLNRIKLSYKKIFNSLRKKKYYVNLHYRPLHLSPYFVRAGFKKNSFPVAEDFGKSALSIPIYYDLNIHKVDRICSEIIRYLK
jgi:UDP-4-amino-4,6-dideoxy-N-acetyl-beta-L-altrosamine transaminase